MLLNPVQLNSYYTINQVIFGGGRRSRTDGLLRAKQALSQLSYTPIHTLEDRIRGLGLTIHILLLGIKCVPITENLLKRDTKTVERV